MDFATSLALVLFFSGNVISTILFAKSLRRDKDFDRWMALDPDYLQQEWEWRQNNQALEGTMGILKALGWFALCIPIMQTAWILSRSGKYKVGLHAGMVAFAIAGSITELVSRLFIVGTSNMTQWMAKDFAMENWIYDESGDKIGWRVLEVASLTANGMLMWVDAFEWLFLFCIMVSIFISIKGNYDESGFGQRWANFGLLVGILCLFDFLANVLRLEDWRTFMIIALFISIVNTLFFLPIWLLLLGFKLSVATRLYEEAEAAAFIERQNRITSTTSLQEELPNAQSGM